MLWIGPGKFLGEDRHEREGERIAENGRHGDFVLISTFLVLSCCRGAGGDAKDLTALGGKVGSAGPGVEAEEGEGVEVGADGVKLSTLGVGEVDKDAVLQPAKAEVDRVKAASQEIVFEVLDI